MLKKKLEVIYTKKISSREEGGCRSCENPPLISFNWQYAREHKDKELSNLAKHLDFVQKLKYGSLYSCNTCGQHWYLDAGQALMSRIPKDRMAILFEWNAKVLAPSAEHLSVLNAIGGTGPDQYGNNEGIIEVPCAVTLHSGESVNPAVIWIINSPPIQDFFHQVILFDSVQSIQPSDYALPLDVRIATRYADEISMGFAPTRVKSVQGQAFVLNWAICNFECNGVKGTDIRISNTLFPVSHSVPIVSQDFDRTTYVFMDWFQGAEILMKKQQEGRNTDGKSCR